jgi:RND family efflux transporter MFP subunit
LDVSLSFPLGGTLTRVAVRNGDRVQKGQLLAEVDATSAASLHATALATLRQAEDAYRRLEAVHREGGLSEVKWVEMETNLEKARQAEVSARKHMEDCSLRAPFAGVVVCGSRTVGQELKPGESFCRVLDMQRLRVGFSVPEQEITLIQVGDAADAVVPALEGCRLCLRVSDKSLNANPLGHTYRVYASVVSGERKNLLPDMVAKVHANLRTQGGIVVPSECVQTMPEGTVVWVVKDGRTEHRVITVGDFVRNGVVVKAGLAAGDTVVTAGQQKLYTGAKVRVENGKWKVNSHPVTQ